ncbi:MAG: lamin tail domain-containing protein, partial [Verrucomicrobiia bacterium]
PQTPDTSQGRSPDGAAVFAHFDNPTPGSANPGSSPPGEIVTLTFPLISQTNVWKYWQNGDAGTEWRKESFDDSSWPAGEAPFGHDSDPTALPLRTQLTIGKMTYYFRTRFLCPTNAPGIRLQLQTYIDDGAALWLNGSLLHLVNISTNNPVYSTRADSTVNNAVLSGPYDIAPGLLREGTNTLAVEVHQSSTSSADVIFSIRLDAVLRITNTIDESLLVRLNEILASNASFTNAAGLTPDYVELANIASRDVDLSGWSLTDDSSNPRRYVFPAGSVIPANGFLVMECEGSSPASRTNVGFDLPASGGTLMLFAPTDTITPVDSVRFGLQVTDLSIGRTGHGTGNWTLTVPTFGADNEPLLTGNPFLLRINEWMAAPTKGEDWFELYNPGQQPVNISGLFLTDDLTDRTRHKLSALSFIGTGPHAYVKFVADGNAGSGANHVNFKLAANGEQIGLFTESGALIDAVMFGPQTDGVSEGRFPDGSDSVVRFVETPTPGAPNQIQPEPDSDRDGMPDSWEIANQLDPHDPADAGIDSDADGLTNLEEYLAGTLPHDPQSVLSFNGIEVANDVLHLRFYGIAGHAYLVEVADAIGTGTWAPFAEVPVLAQNGLVEVTDQLSDTSGLRLYRVVLLPR